MPPKRARSAAVEDEAEASGSTAKKSKTVAEIDGFQVRWEWEDDGGVWRAYVPELSAAISETYVNKAREMEFTVAKTVGMRILLEKMVQKNKKTGWERRIRCCIKDGSDFMVWEWQDEHSRWNPYAADATLSIETTKNDGEDLLKLKTFGREYELDLGSMKQVNQSTNVERTIQRVKSSATLPAPGDAANITFTVPKPKAAANAKAATKSSAGKKGSVGSKKGNTGLEEEDEGESSVKTVVVKGRAPVDIECASKKNVAHVFCEGKDVYDVMLNQTNVMNNNNKYFIIQLLEDDNKKVYTVWFRWGRVGYKGQNNLVPCGSDLEEAKDVFCKKFLDKTKNDWADRGKFKKVAGKYDLVQLDYGATGDEVDGTSKKKKSANGAGDAKVPDSELDVRLQALMQLICDVKAMEDMVLEMKYDAKKAPLGKLTQKQIKAGYSALKIIDTCITKNDYGQKLVQACNDFYTRIPHEFGMTRPPLIRTKEDVKAKIKLIEALSDIEVAMKIINDVAASVNPIDSHYNSLKCALDPLDSSDSDFKMIEDYVAKTHAPTHNQYKMKVLDVFAVDKEGEEEKYNDVGNKMLLWHGSRLTNWMGILSQGLRIAPPEAPVTGYMFGKGVYFADCSSKSANYCFASRANNTGLLLLCEVALGNMNGLLAADYEADQLPGGKHSVKGLGKLAPDSKKDFTMPDGVVVPLGKCIDTGVHNPNGYTLNYNEFIVYNTNQIKTRYLVKVRFDFK